jgi:hypothetical protein
MRIVRSLPIVLALVAFAAFAAAPDPARLSIDEASGWSPQDGDGGEGFFTVSLRADAVAADDDSVFVAIVFDRALAPCDPTPPEEDGVVVASGAGYVVREIRNEDGVWGRAQACRETGDVAVQIEAAYVVSRPGWNVEPLVRRHQDVRDMIERMEIDGERVFRDAGPRAAAR